jgi:RNA recognition motif-containing protein
MTLYVGNLSLEVSEEELRRKFEAFGRVTFVTTMNGKRTGSGPSTGHGFVEMASKLEGCAAITGLNGTTLKGRRLHVIQALPVSPSTRRGADNNRRGDSCGGREGS